MGCLKVPGQQLYNGLSLARLVHDIGLRNPDGGEEGERLQDCILDSCLEPVEDL